MIFTDDGVDLPEQLLQSLASNRLVVFVGAGVSMQAYRDQPPNTYYPGFRDLAEQIAQRLGHTISEKDKESLRDNYVDRVLGDWDDQTGDIKEHAATILQTNENGQRLDRHRAIIRLFKSKLTPRIVTTNFDRLLTRALEAEARTRNSRWSVAKAPFLPPVRRFSGICYLHGSVDEPIDMILTDKGQVSVPRCHFKID
jgi:NAD-dependent SIR2 family protein deacetylase